MTTHRKSSQEKKRQKPFDEYLKYSGIAFQMMAALGVGAWVGHYFDGLAQNETPVYTLLGLLLGITAGIVAVIKSLND